MHMPLPSTQDAIGQTASQSHSERKMTRPAKCVRESTRGRKFPIPKARRDDSITPDSSNNLPMLIGVVVGVVGLLITVTWALIRHR
ncbi:hypothetical protein PILCRDRAFT_823013 [Piloderma croceum F 1598]|uniref:Uncharacterized protein n=1 Tax=Piloderma croceum (strain F 1598) TaxID=765440 RepID=A0A0C3F542_PILCF|nr:hypothetical protein PILCRDRAFT_823013 [Piloderma croceum F 1598]